MVEEPTELDRPMIGSSADDDTDWWVCWVEFGRAAASALLPRTGMCRGAWSTIVGSGRTPADGRPPRSKRLAKTEVVPAEWIGVEREVAAGKCAETTEDVETVWSIVTRFSLLDKSLVSELARCVRVVVVGRGWRSGPAPDRLGGWFGNNLTTKVWLVGRRKKSSPPPPLLPLRTWRSTAAQMSTPSQKLISTQV